MNTLPSTFRILKSKLHAALRIETLPLLLALAVPAVLGVMRAYVSSRTGLLVFDEATYFQYVLLSRDFGYFIPYLDCSYWRSNYVFLLYVFSLMAGIKDVFAFLQYGFVLPVGLSVLTLLILYKIHKTLGFDDLTASLAVLSVPLLLVFAFDSVLFMTEAPSLFLLTLGLYFLFLWIKRSRDVYFVISMILVTHAVLTRITFLPYLLLVLLYLMNARTRLKVPKFAGILIVSVLLPAMFRPQCLFTMPSPSQVAPPQVAHEVGLLAEYKEQSTSFAGYGRYEIVAKGLDLITALLGNPTSFLYTTFKNVIMSVTLFWNAPLTVVSALGLAALLYNSYNSRGALKRIYSSLTVVVLVAFLNVTLTEGILTSWNIPITFFKYSYEGLPGVFLAFPFGALALARFARNSGARLSRFRKIAARYSKDATALVLLAMVIAGTVWAAVTWPIMLGYVVSTSFPQSAVSSQEEVFGLSLKKTLWMETCQYVKHLKEAPSRETILIFVYPLNDTRLQDFLHGIENVTLATLPMNETVFTGLLPKFDVVLFYNYYYAENIPLPNYTKTIIDGKSSYVILVKVVETPEGSLYRFELVGPPLRTAESAAAPWVGSRTQPPITLVAPLLACSFSKRLS